MKTYTLKSDCINKKAVMKELNEKFPGLLIWNIFHPSPKPSSRIKVRVYCRRWSGEWTGYTKNHYCNLY